MLYGTGKDLKQFMENREMTVNKDFAGWYYNREEFIRIYGEPSDSLIREFKHEVDCMVMQVAEYNKPSVRMTEKDRDHAMALFNEFWNDHVDEEAINHSDTIEFYHAQVKGYSIMDTCLVLGMITGCIKNDDYEEGELIARMYLNVSEDARHKAWEERQDTNSGPQDEYGNIYTTTNEDTSRVMRLVVANLKDDEPQLEVCIVLCDSLYAELLEIEANA